MAIPEKIALTSHTAFHPKGIAAVSVRLAVRPDHIWLAYEVDHAGTLLLTDFPDGRQDNLWKHTCFELFAKTSSERKYVEYNMAPFFAWAAYEFPAYRAGMKEAAVVEPHLVDGRLEDRAHQADHCYEYCAVIAREGPLRDPGAMLNLTAVIEERDGTKSYWALAHPDGPPDFHDPDCFVLALPAA